MFSRTGAMLLGAYVALLAALLAFSNTLIVGLYEMAGLTAAATAIPLTLDVPLSVAAAGYLAGLPVSAYLSVVAVRTFVDGDGERFPSGAFTRNAPLATANVVVGGLVYGLAVALGSLALLVPGVIAYVSFIFMLPYVALEDRNFVDALRSSYRLSRGNWLEVFAVVVIVVSVAGAVGTVGGVASLFLPPTAGQIALVVVQSPVSLYVLAVIAAAFEQLRAEGVDSDGSTPSAETPSSPA